MSTVSIPTRAGTDLPIYTETATLDGVPFQLFLQWNIRQACWYLSIATIDGIDVWNGLKLVCGWDLMLGCADDRRPAGRLVVVSNSADSSPPGLDDLGPSGRCVLVYIERADVVAAVTAALAAEGV